MVPRAGRCPCSSAARSPDSRRADEPHRQRPAHEIESPPLTPLLRRPARGARRHEPEGRLRAGRLRRLHRPRRRRAPARSCLLPVGAVDGAEITTLEGLGAPERPRSRSRPRSTTTTPPQCGFCTSGLLMAAHGLLERTPDGRPRGDRGRARRPRLPLHRLREDRRRRRGGAPTAPPPPTGARRESRRRTASRATTASHTSPGAPTSSTTFDVPGMLAWAKALRSPHPPRRHREARHARAAEQINGVRAVVTRSRRAAQRLRPPRGARHPRRRAAARRERGALRRPADCRRRRRGRGDRARPPSTRSRSSSRSAQPLFDVRKAFDPDAPQIHEWGNWYPHFEADFDHRQIRKGDIDARLRAGRPDRPGRLPAGRDRAAPDRDPGLPGRARGRTAG